MQTEFLQNGLGIVGKFFELFVGFFRTGKLYELDFLELMLPDDAANVLAVRTGFAAKTWRVGGERDGQSRAVNDLVAVEIRHWHFSGRD